MSKILLALDPPSRHQLPFDRLMALSKAEGPFDKLMVLSKVDPSTSLWVDAEQV
jgi:hypothetical protein